MGTIPTKPTDQAQFYFQAVSDVLTPLAGYPDNAPARKDWNRSLCFGLSKLADGLQGMAIGLRATYILLEQVSAQLKAKS
jgi:hypothetical protein